MKKFYLIYLICSIPYLNAEDVLCTINARRALHQVDEKFLSISIDPAVLLAGVNLSDTSLKLAQHLSPAYIRIAGPSTQFVKYVDTESKSTESRSDEEAANVIVTPSMWFGINEWLTLANLTPVFGINEAQTSKLGQWNPNSKMHLLELSDKLNISCMWQLGFGCANDMEKYATNLHGFRTVLDGFPEKNNTWQIIGSSDCLLGTASSPDLMRKAISGVKNDVGAIMWSPPNGINFPELDAPATTLLKSNIPIWTTIPKTARPASFETAMLYAREIGEAAKLGFQVVFRQPRLHEIFLDTPAYWFSYWHKKLMGTTVLEISKAHHDEAKAGIYAHCTKKQNSYAQRGAMTVMVINNGSENFTALLKIASPHLLRGVEIESYVLTSPGAYSTEIFLNDEKLSLENCNQEPKIRLAKSNNRPIDLVVEPNSIAFFVFPGIQIPVCINNEVIYDRENFDDDLNSAPLSFPNTNHVTIETRRKQSKRTTLRDIQLDMQKELQSDEQYYKKQTPTIVRKNPRFLFGTDRINDGGDKKVDSSARNFFIERAKHAERRRIFEKKTTSEASLMHFATEAPYKQTYLDRINAFRRNHIKNKKVPLMHNSLFPKKHIDLDLTSSEINVVLKSRAKSKAAKKNISFTSQELDTLIGKVTRKFKRSIAKRDINRKLLLLKQSEGDKLPTLSLLERMRINLRKLSDKRVKRDINMDLIKRKVGDVNFKPEITTSVIQTTPTTTTEEVKISSSLDNFSTEMLEDEDFASISHETKNEDDKFVEEIYKEVKPLGSADKSKSSRFISETHEFDLEDEEKYLDDKDDLEKKLEAIVVQPEQTKSAEISFESGLDFSDDFSTHPKFKREITNKISKDMQKLVLRQNLRGLKLVAQEEQLKNEEERYKRELELLNERTKSTLSKETLDLFGTDDAKDDRKALDKNIIALQKKLDHTRKRIEKLQKKEQELSEHESYQEFRNKLYQVLAEAQSGLIKNDTKEDGIKLVKRAADDSRENLIDSYLNDIEKDNKYIHPELDHEHGDYQLILPNKDKFEIKEDANETNVEFVHHKKNLSEETTTEETLTTLLSEYEDLDVPKEETKKPPRKSNIQVIPSKEEHAVVKQFLKNVGHFFHDVGSKFKDYIEHLFK